MNYVFCLFVTFYDPWALPLMVLPGALPMTPMVVLHTVLWHSKVKLLTRYHPLMRITREMLSCNAT